MGQFSMWHWLIVLAVVLLLFGGGGKIPKLMKDMGQGINAFKRGLKEEDKNKPTDTVGNTTYDRAIEENSATPSAMSRKDTLAG